MAQSKNSSFSYKDGYLYCEDVQVKDLQQQLQEVTPYCSPFYLYSQAQIKENVAAYREPLEKLGFNYMLGFAIKANYNPHIVELMAQCGCTAVTVSGNEIRLALDLGIPGSKIIYNGNGKSSTDVDLAVTSDCLINIDSHFDLITIIKAARNLQHRVRVLIRVNPDISTNVHNHLATGLADSKFGVIQQHLNLLLEEINNNNDVINLVGLHCHLGSTIETTDVFKTCLKVMLDLTQNFNDLGFGPLRYINLGGGLGINYRADKPMPEAEDLVKVVEESITSKGLTLILEPGRSLIGNAGVLICKVLGTKRMSTTDFIVVDGGMTEVIRPCLYNAYHRIMLTEPSQVTPTTSKLYSVVGPVCECADFLGKDRELPEPHTGCGLAVCDVGAYCASMASNYNLRLRPAEVLVSKNSWRLIRKPDTLEDILKPYNVSNS